MSSIPLNWLTTHFSHSTPTDLITKLLLTILLLFLTKKLLTFFFIPFFKDYHDPAMLIETPQERAKRDLKARKRIGTLPPFPNGWYRLICSGELLPGQVKYVSALGKEWAVFRTAQGKPGVVGVYCPHLGADLSQGRVVGENLVCPFHAFHFDTKGNCSKIPYQDSIPKGAKCQDVPVVVERNGGINIWYDVDSKEPGWEIPDILSTAREQGSLKFIGRAHHRIHTHVQEIHENGADSAHLPYLHRGTFFNLRVFWHEWGMQWDANKEVKHMSDFVVNEAIKIGNYYVPFTKFHVIGHHVGPGFVHLTFHTYFGPLHVVHSVLPLEGFVQDNVYQMWASKWVPLWFGKLIMMGWMQQLEKDVMVWNQKIFLPAAQIVSNDGPIAQYRKWFKQFYSEKGTKKQFNLADRDLF